MGWKGKEPTREELKRTFDVFDADGSGFVTSRQLYFALRASGWTAEFADVEALIAKVDNDRDAMLSFDEFSQLMREVLLQDEVRLSVRRGGSRDTVLRTGKVLNVRDVDRDPRITDASRDRYKLRGYDVRSLLLAPVFDEETNEVIGLVELVNKEVEADADAPPATAAAADGAKPLTRRNSEFGFNRDDERLLRMLCSHTSIFLRHLETGRAELNINQRSPCWAICWGRESMWGYDICVREVTMWYVCGMFSVYSFVIIRRTRRHSCFIR